MPGGHQQAPTVVSAGRSRQDENETGRGKHEMPKKQQSTRREVGAEVQDPEVSVGAAVPTVASPNVELVANQCGGVVRARWRQLPRNL